MPGRCRSSPREWGCFCLFTLAIHEASVFPTRVGVFPYGAGSGRLSYESSPREWGCFSGTPITIGLLVVFPELPPVLWTEQAGKLGAFRPSRFVASRNAKDLEMAGFSLRPKKAAPDCPWIGDLLAIHPRLSARTKTEDPGDPIRQNQFPEAFDSPALNATARCCRT